jgi:hypothetical protein
MHFYDQAPRPPLKSSHPTRVPINSTSGFWICNCYWDRHVCPKSYDPWRLLCIRCFWQEVHHTYGHIRCVYTVLANPTYNQILPILTIPALQAIYPTEYEGVKVVSFGYAGQGSAIMRGPMVSGLIQQMLTTTEWGEWWSQASSNKCSQPRNGVSEKRQCKWIMYFSSLIDGKSSQHITSSTKVNGPVASGLLQQTLRAQNGVSKEAFWWERYRLPSYRNRRELPSSLCCVCHVYCLCYAMYIIAFLRPLPKQ